MNSFTKLNDNIIHVPFKDNIDENKSLGQFLLEGFEKYKSRVAQIDADNGNTETFGELLKRCISLAQALKTKGLTSNDIISYCCYNNMDYILAIVASVFIGAKFSALDITAAPNEITHCLKITSPKIIFCENQQENLLESCIKQAGINCEIIVFDQSDKFVSMKNFVEKYKSYEEFKIDTTKTLKDASCVAFTSGTSGMSKGAQLSDFGLYYGSLTQYSLIPEGESLLSFTLPYWVSNITYCIISILGGVGRVILRKCDFSKIMKIIQDFKITSTLLNQHTMNDLIKNPHWCDYDTSCLKMAYFGGSRIGYNQIKNIEKVLPHTLFVHGYGMTETAGVCLYPRKEILLDTNENISAGIPLPGLYYKIVDTDTDEILGPNKPGELKVKYKGTMTGYLNQPELTAQAFDEDGFFKTGDVVYYDENHNFFVVDRLKEIFKFKGWHISPSYIENAIIQLEEVKECAVIPVPHEHDGELPMAVVLLKENAKITEEDIIKHIKDTLADVYQLRGGVKFVNSLPKTSTGKLQRRYLKKLILE